MKSISKQNLDELAALRHFFLDMDGTIYLGARGLPGAAEFIAYLRESGRRFLFLTNNPSADAGHYSRRLRRIGIEAGPDSILTAGEATIRYVLSETAHRRVYVLGTPSFEAECEAAGLLLDDSEPEAVILSFDKTLTYAKLERAARLLLQGLPYIATNPDKVCPTEAGPIPDCGAMAALLFEATGRGPKYIGKPNPEIVRMGFDKLGADPATTAVVGDRLYTDMAMARRASVMGILVLSGETTRADLTKIEELPNHVFENVGELLEALIQADGGRNQ